MTDKMTEKYYTPEADEFCIGFPYEWNYQPNRFDSDEYWLKQIYDPKDFISISSYDDWSFDLQKDINNGCIRVKYLDREDIESCGFTDLGSLWFEKKDCITVSGEGPLTCGVRKWKDLQVIIHVLYSDIDNDIIFNGNIKNLYEFKQTLKRLGYEQ